MGYYIRVLGKNTNAISFGELKALVEPAALTVEEGPDENWQRLCLAHPSGIEIAMIERNIVSDGLLGAEELEEFLEEASVSKPDSGASWLKEYLPTVGVIYAFQVLNGAEAENGWDMLHSLHSAIWNRCGGILQSDGEGMSNEDGYTIIWQFGVNVTGDWNMAILGSDDRWTSFKMDLGSTSQRAAFLRGEVPAEAVVINR